MSISNWLFQVGDAGTGGAEFSWLWSLIIPGVVLFSSVIATFLLYRHFSKKMGGDQ